MNTNGTTLYRLWQRQRTLRLRLILVIVVCVGLFLWLRPHIFPAKPIEANTSNPNASSNTTAASGALPKGKPDYATVSPDQKSIEWTRVSPPDHNAVFAYADTISGIPITVSEQPLPDSLKNGSDNKLEDLAKSYDANRFINVDGTKVYIGTSAKGPQSLILSKKSLLILIKSTAALNDEQWSIYIKSLN